MRLYEIETCRYDYGNDSFTSVRDECEENKL